MTASPIFLSMLVLLLLIFVRLFISRKASENKLL